MLTATADASIPYVSISAQEVADGCPSESTLRRGVELFTSSGFLIIQNAFDVRLISHLREAFMDCYASRSMSEIANRSLLVGEGRYMITVEVDTPFNEKALYANAFLHPLLVQCLSKEMVLNSFGCVCAFPGAKTQHFHRDHPSLFGAHYPSAGMPPYAITLVVPLIDLDLSVGTTAVIKASHKETAPTSAQLTILTPRVGDAYLMDYRLIHGGTPNSSAVARPILYLVYSRPWFRDSVNFFRQPPLKISSNAFQMVDSDYKSLFKYATLNYGINDDK